MTGKAVPVVPVSLGSPAVHSRELEGFRALLATFPASLHLPPHSHERSTLAVILRGEFRKNLLKGTQDCRTSSVIAEPAGERHANWFGPRGARVVLLQPEPEADGHEAGWEGLFAVPRAFLDPAIAELARRVADELSAPDDLSSLALQALGLELFVAAQRRGRGTRSGPPPPWLARVEELLRAHFTEPVRMGALASAVGHHPVHVARVFRAHHGTTVAGYIRRLRVAWAQEQLRRPEAVAAEVALRAGFNDQSHFIRAFRRVMGVSPGRWRRRLLDR